VVGAGAVVGCVAGSIDAAGVCAGSDTEMARLVRAANRIGAKQSM
jgi:hypothetical protein